MPRILKIDVVCSYCDETMTAHINKDTDEKNNQNLAATIVVMGLHEERDHATVS